jgi:hypothetical protein
MKFTREQANKELVAKMTANGEKLSVSDRTINEHLDTLMPLMGEEMELQDFVEKCLPLFKSTDANVRNDVSVGIREYKAANPVVEPQKTSQEPTAQRGGEYADLLKRIEELENEKARASKEKKVGTIKEEIVSKLKSKGVKDDEWINALLSEVNVTEDFQVDAKVESYLGLYNKQNAVIDPIQTPVIPKSGKNQLLDDVLAEAESYAKNMLH